MAAKLASGYIDLTVKYGGAMDAITREFDRVESVASRVGNRAGGAIEEGLAQGARRGAQAVSDAVDTGLVTGARRAGQTAARGVLDGVQQGLRGGSTIGTQLPLFDLVVDTARRRGQDSGREMGAATLRGFDATFKSAGRGLFDTWKNDFFRIAGDIDNGITQWGQTFRKVWAAAPDVLRSVGTQLRGAATRIGQAVGTAMGVAFKAGLTVAVAGATAVLGGALYVLYRGMQRLEVIDTATFKLRQFGLTAEQTAQVLRNANEAVKGTPFPLAESVTAATNAFAAGIQPGRDMVAYLTQIADAAAAGNGNFNEMALIFDRIHNYNTLYAQDLEMLQTQGIPIIQWLSEEFQISADEVREWVSDGRLGFEAFTTVMQKNTRNMAQALGGTFRGSLNNVQAALSRLGATALEPFFTSFAPMLSNLEGGIDSFGEKVREMQPSMVGWVGGVVDFMFAATQSVLGFISRSLEGLSNLSAAMIETLQGMSSAFRSMEGGPLGSLLGLDFGGMADGLDSAVEALAPLPGNLMEAAGAVDIARQSVGGMREATAEYFEILKRSTLLTSRFPALSQPFVDEEGRNVALLDPEQVEEIRAKLREVGLDIGQEIEPGKWEIIPTTDEGQSIIDAFVQKNEGIEVKPKFDIDTSMADRKLDELYKKYPILGRFAPRQAGGWWSGSGIRHPDDPGPQPGASVPAPENPWWDILPGTPEGRARDAGEMWRELWDFIWNPIWEGPPGRAMGGAIRDRFGRLHGPGSGTSDSILGVDNSGMPLVRVSAGEGVVTKWAMDNGAAPWVAAFNAGKIPGLQDGGTLDFDPWSGPNLGSAGPAIRRPLDYALPTPVELGTFPGGAPAGRMPAGRPIEHKGHRFGETLEGVAAATEAKVVGGGGSFGNRPTYSLALRDLMFGRGRSAGRTVLAAGLPGFARGGVIGSLARSLFRKLPRRQTGGAVPPMVAVQAESSDVEEMMPWLVMPLAADSEPAMETINSLRIAEEGDEVRLTIDADTTEAARSLDKWIKSLPDIPLSFSGGTGPGMPQVSPGDMPSILRDVGSVASGPNSRMAASAVQKLWGDQIRGQIGGSRDTNTAKGTHDAGLSIDIPIGPDQMGLGDEIRDFFMANAEEFGMKYIIWRNQGMYPGDMVPDFEEGGHMNHIDIHFEAAPASGSMSTFASRGNQGSRGSFRNASNAARTLSNKQDIANYIRQRALAEGYSEQQADWFVIQAFGESGLDPTASNPAGWEGIFQFDAPTWRMAGGGDQYDAQTNIDNYFRLARQRGLSPSNFRRGEQLGTQVSIGGPFHPENAAKGHLSNAMAEAQPYLNGTGSTTVSFASRWRKGEPEPKREDYPTEGEYQKDYMEWYDSITEDIRDRRAVDDANRRIADLQKEIAKENERVAEAQKALDDEIRIQSHPGTKDDPERIKKLEEELQDRKDRLTDLNDDLERAKEDLELEQREQARPDFEEQAEDWWGSDNPYFKILEGLSQLMPDFEEAGNIVSGAMTESFLPEGFSDPTQWGVLRGAGSLLRWLGGLRQMGSNAPIFGTEGSAALSMFGSGIQGDFGGVVRGFMQMVPEPIGTMPLGDPQTGGPPEGRPNPLALLGMIPSGPTIGPQPPVAHGGSGAEPGPGGGGGPTDNSINIGTVNGSDAITAARTTATRWQVARSRAQTNPGKVTRI